VHLRNILEKLQLRNRQQAAAFAISSGLVRLWQGQSEAGAAVTTRQVVQPRRINGMHHAAARSRSV
jgi:hypothetical protein